MITLRILRQEKLSWVVWVAGGSDRKGLRAAGLALEATRPWGQGKQVASRSWTRLEDDSSYGLCHLGLAQ